MRTRRIEVPAGEELVYAPDDWNDSLVVVEEGAIEVESRHGARRTFGAGSVLWLQRMRIRVLRNSGEAATVLTARSRA